MTRQEAFLWLRANPLFERIPDSILRGYVGALRPLKEDSGEQQEALTQIQLSELKLHLQEYLQYYAVHKAS